MSDGEKQPLVKMRVDLCIKTGFDKWGSMDCTLGSATQSGASQRDNTILISHLWYKKNISLVVFSWVWEEISEHFFPFVILIILEKHWGKSPIHSSQLCESVSILITTTILKRPALSSNKSSFQAIYNKKKLVGRIRAAVPKQTSEQQLDILHLLRVAVSIGSGGHQR